MKMLGWTITFFLIAIVAAIFGFSGLGGIFAYVSQLLAALFLFLFVASLIYLALTLKT